MSAPSQLLLIIIGVARTKNRIFEYAEPLVATFSREIVDFNNKSVMTAAQAAALVAAMGSGLSLRAVAIPNGVDYVTVTGLGLATTPSKCLVSVMKPNGGGNIFATCRASSLSTDGFTADLDGVTDSGNYQLVFAIS